MKLVLAEKPSVAMSLSKVIGADQRGDGYMEGNGYLVSWCVGHLVELSQPEAYDEKYAKWKYLCALECSPYSSPTAKRCLRHNYSYRQFGTTTQSPSLFADQKCPSVQAPM